MSAVDISAPRLAGDRNPIMERKMHAIDTLKMCTPVPTATAKSSGLGGDRKTSPHTSFHPMSCFDWLSASSSSFRSFLTVLMRMRKMIPEKKNTTSMELRMLNQCTCEPRILR